MSPRWTSYVVPKPPKGWLKNAKCPKFEQYAVITPKRYEIGCQLVLITNRKSHTGFRLIYTDLDVLEWPKMTLNSVIGPILRFFHRISIALLANYVIVVEGKPIMSVKYCSQFQSSTFGHNSPTLQRGLSAIAELLFKPSPSFLTVQMLIV